MPILKRESPSLRGSKRAALHRLAPRLIRWMISNPQQTKEDEMTIWEVFDSNNQPHKILNVHCRLHNVWEMKDLGAAIEMKRHDLARILAEEILKNPNIIRMIPADETGMLQIDGECIVLSLEDWRDECTKKFQDGMECGQGYRPGYRP